MIQQITEVPDNMVGFRASGEVTKQDYDNVVFPAVKELVKRTGQLNYLMVIDTSPKNFTLGAWFDDALLGLKELMAWHKAAILTNSPGLNKFTDLFGKVAPGKFKGFKPEELNDAIDWVSA